GRGTACAPRRRSPGRSMRAGRSRSCRRFLARETREGLPDHVDLVFGDGPDEVGERGVPVAGLVQRAQHQLGHVVLPAGHRPVAPGAAVALALEEAFLGEPVQDRHDRGVCEVPVAGEGPAHVAGGRSLVTGVLPRPEDLHDRAFELSQTFHAIQVNRRSRRPPRQVVLPPVAGRTSPVSYAMITRWTRSRASSLVSSRATCAFAVATLMTSSAAISWLDMPRPTSVSTSRSLAVTAPSARGPLPAARGPLPAACGALPAGDGTLPAGGAGSGRAANSSIRRRVTLGAISASPPA